MLKVSVITICYNSVQTIEQTIQSVINQNYPNIEYIIIDGGSTDGTIDIIKRYESHIAKWVSEPDRGIYDAMNKGIVMATGDIIGTINSDDWYTNDALTAVIKYFDENKYIELVYGDIVTINNNIKITKSIVDTPSDRIYWFWQPAVFVKKCLYLRNGLFDVRYAYVADAAYFLHLQSLQVNIGYLPEVLAYFRYGGASTDRQHKRRVVREMIRMYEEAINWFYFDVIKTRELVFCLDHAKLIYASILRDFLRRKYLCGTNELRFWQSLLQIKGKQHYVIWGIGFDGEKLWEDFTALRSLVRGYVDRKAIEHRDVSFHNHNVNVPIDFIRKNDLIIIATGRYADSICNELDSFGFKYKSDYLIFTNLDFVRYMSAFLITGGVNTNVQ